MTAVRNRHWNAYCLSGALMFVLATSLVSCGKQPSPPESKPPRKGPPALSAEVEQLLQKKMVLVAALVSEPVIVEAARESNIKNRNLTKRQIQELDQKWIRTRGVDEFIRGFMTNPAAVRLVEFQKSHLEFREVFVADARGLNVCQTNKTSDYLQADEDWWVIAFDSGRGKAHHGRIEYDESSHTRAISIYVPVMDPGTKGAIGVCKAVIDLDALGREL